MKIDDKLKDIDINAAKTKVRIITTQSQKHKNKVQGKGH